MTFNLTETLTQWMYAISTAFLVPVVVAVLGLFVLNVVLLGGLLRECWERRRLRQGMDRAVALALSGDDQQVWWKALEGIPTGLPARFVRASASAGADRVAWIKIVADLESDVSVKVARLSFSTRVGPMLGLMGTLIPLGPALTALAGGNLGELSSSLIVAFTATVIGLIVSCLAYGMGLVRRTWYARDLSDLEFLVERMKTPAGRPACDESSGPMLLPQSATE